MLFRSYRLVRSMLLLATVMLSACASMPSHDPLQVTVAGVESIPGEGMELRMLVKLRVQNPNDAPLDYNGAYLKLDVLGRSFASGVSDESGTVPRFGEAVIGVPVTVSVLRMASTALGMLDGKPMDKVSYELRGKLSGRAFSAARFRSRGELDLRSAQAR